jgi:hypothetical protein
LSPRGEQSSPSGPDVASVANGEASFQFGDGGESVGHYESPSHRLSSSSGSGFEEFRADLGQSLQASELAFRLQGNGDNPCDGLDAARDDDVFAGLGACDQLGELR